MKLLLFFSVFIMSVLAQADIKWHKDFKIAKKIAIQKKQPLLVVLR